MPERNLESTPISSTSASSTHLQSDPQPDLVDIPTIRLLEERLNVKINQHKVGEVVVRKVVETEIVEIPIRREKIVIEQVAPEHKQLASVDLGTGFNQEELADLMIDRTADATVGTSAGVGDESLSIEFAQQLLNAILNQPAYQNSKVKLIFEDASLQTAYQRWRERYIVR